MQLAESYNMTLTEWALWTAATMADSDVRDTLINYVHLRAGETQIDGIFPAAYSIDTGKRDYGEASSTHGAIFAPMALDLPVQIESGRKRKLINEGGPGASHAGAIAGGIIGGVVVIVSIVLAIIFWHRHQQRKKEREEEETKPADISAYEYSVVAPLPRNKAGLTNHAPALAMMQVNLPQRSNRKRGRNSPLIQSQPITPQPSTSSAEPAPPPQPASDVDIDIQIEVERLLREVEEIRASGGDVRYEPPPQYQT
jgi:hypothetical protein